MAKDALGNVKTTRLSQCIRHSVGKQVQTKFDPNQKLAMDSDSSVFKFKSKGEEKIFNFLNSKYRTLIEEPQALADAKELARILGV